MFLTTANALQILLAYSVHLVAGRTLPEATYGSFVVVLSIIAWTKNLHRAVLIPGLQKAVSEEHSRLASALSVARKVYVPFTLILLAVFLGLTPVLGRIFGDRSLVFLLVLSSAEIPFCALETLGRRLFNALRRYTTEALLMVVFSFTRALVACALILIGFGAAGGVGGLAMGSVAAGVLAWFLLVREKRRQPASHYPPMLRRSLSWTAVSVPMIFGWTTLGVVDLWLVKGLLEDATLVGIYGAAYTISRLPQFLNQGLAGAVYPRVSGLLAAGRKTQARSASRESLRLVIVIFTPICCLVASSATDLASLLFTARYACAGPPLALLIFANGLLAYLVLNLSLIAATDRPGVRMSIVLALLPVVVVLNLLFIPVWGLIGASAASLIGLGLGTVVTAWIVYRLLALSPPGWTLLRCGLCGAVIFLAGRLWSVTGWWLLGEMALLGLGYLLLLFLLGELRREDYFALKHSLRS